MPIVSIQITREGTSQGQTCVTSEQKRQLIEGASQLLLEVLNKPMSSTFVVIEEVELDNWGWGGLPVADYRRRVAAAAELLNPPLSANEGKKRYAGDDH